MAIDGPHARLDDDKPPTDMDGATKKSQAISEDAIEDSSIHDNTPTKPSENQIADSVGAQTASAEGKDAAQESVEVPNEAYALMKDMLSALDKDGIEEKDAQYTVEDETKHALFYPILLERHLDERRQEAPKRLLQQVAYTKLVEDRIANLENKWKTMEQKLRYVTKEAEASQSNDSEEKHKFTSTLGINRCSFEEYKPKSQNLDSKDPNLGSSRFEHVEKQHTSLEDMPVPPRRHLIDVVVSHASVVSDSDKKPLVDAVDITHAAPGQDSPEVFDKHRVNYEVPERIRLNSPLLLRTLETITDTKFTPSPSYKPMDQVMLRPFKLLVTFEQRIREYTQQLAEKCALDVPQENAMQPAGHPGETAPNHDSTLMSGSRSPSEATSKSHENGIGAVGTDAKPDIASVNDENVEEGEDRETSERRLQELQVLIELLNNDLKPIFDLRKSISEACISDIAYDDLWHLFRIGDEIRTNESDAQIYRVIGVFGGRPPLSGRSFASPENGESDDPVDFTVNSICYGFDGKQIDILQATFYLSKYEGKKPIVSLPAYPITFSATEEDKTISREDLIRRGQKFVELTRARNSVVHKSYHGRALDLEQLPEEVDSEVIIDPAMAILKNPSLELKFGALQLVEPNERPFREFLDPCCYREGCHENTAIHKDFNVDEKIAAPLWETVRSHHPDVLETANLMSPEDLLICPSMLYGYVLRSRKWVRLHIQTVQDITKEEYGFESLVLPEGHSETLLALVETHSRGTQAGAGQKVVDRQIDLVRGKGKGLIILLHGEPGVGKTSTAESIAEYTGRPLFQVTCGDIGDTAEVVERTLENHFQLAHRWGCILLLDEADVFLMARSKTDLHRNAIVSVFLRVLEYYSGILFLTTNRVGTFDSAFRSRIHMSLFYPKLDLKASLEIWKMNLDRTKRLWGENIEIESKERDKILKFAEEHFRDSQELKITWNGRQIRNAFQTAIALAEYEIFKAQKRFKMAEEPKPRLETWQFKKVAEASKHFDEYVKATVGSAEEDLARERFERRDDLGLSDIEQDSTTKNKRTKNIYAA